MDLSGPSRTQKPSGKLYFMLMINDFRKMIWVSFLREKIDAFDKFNNFKAMDKNETDYKVK